MLLTRKTGGAGGGGYHWDNDGDTVEVDDRVARDLLRLDPDEYAVADEPDEDEKPASTKAARAKNVVAE